MTPDDEDQILEGLDPKETVCPVCHLAYWAALVKCSNCELWEPRRPDRPPVVRFADGTTLQSLQRRFVEALDQVDAVAAFWADPYPFFRQRWATGIPV